MTTKNVDGNSESDVAINIYDNSGKLIETRNANNASEKSVFSYSALGRMTSAANYNDTGQLLSEYKFAFNNDGSLHTQTVKLADLENKQVRFVYGYGLDGRRSGKTIYVDSLDSSGQITSSDEILQEGYGYDQFGNLEFSNQVINGHQKSLTYEYTNGRIDKSNYFEANSNISVTTPITGIDNKLFQEVNHFYSDGRLEYVESHAFSANDENSKYDIFQRDFWLNRFGLPEVTKTWYLTSFTNGSGQYDTVREEHDRTKLKDAGQQNVKYFGRELQHWPALQIDIHETGNVKNVDLLDYEAEHVAQVHSNGSWSDHWSLGGDTSTDLPTQEPIRLTLTVTDQFDLRDKLTDYFDTANKDLELHLVSVNAQGGTGESIIVEESSISKGKDDSEWHVDFHIKYHEAQEINSFTNVYLKFVGVNHGSGGGGNFAISSNTATVKVYKRRYYELDWNYKGQLSKIKYLDKVGGSVVTEVDYLYDVFGNQIKVSNESPQPPNGASDPAKYIIPVYENGNRQLIFTKNTSTESAKLNRVGFFDLAGNLRSIENLNSNGDRDSSIWLSRDIDGTAVAWLKTKFGTGADSNKLDRSQHPRRLEYTTHGELKFGSNVGYEDIQQGLVEYGSFFKGFQYDPFMAQFSFQGLRPFSAVAGKFLASNTNTYFTAQRDMYASGQIVPTGASTRLRGYTQYQFSYNQSQAAGGGSYAAALFGRNGLIYDLDTPASAYFANNLQSARSIGSLTDGQLWALSAGAAVGAVATGYAIAPLIGPLAVAGGVAGGVDGYIQTRIANPTASVYELGFGTALGAGFGAIFPFGAFSSLGGGAIGAGGAYLSGNAKHAGTAYQVGSLTGGIIGGNVMHAIAKGGTRKAIISSARRGAAELAGAAGGYYGATRLFGANHNQGLMVANFSAMGTGLIAGRFKFFQCFVAGTPVMVPVSEIPILDPAGTTTLAVVAPPTPDSSHHRGIGASMMAVGLIGVSASGAYLLSPGRKKEETEFEQNSLMAIRPQRFWDRDRELILT